MKHDWKKDEKQFYQPKSKPELVRVPPFKFFSISGEGNPNDTYFGEYISVLYSLSYAVKMSPKKGIAPTGYFEYSVYPLEGVWDISEEAKKKKMETLDKNALVFNLMIRQPDFVDEAFASEMIELTTKKKPHPLLQKARFEISEEKECIQMLHIGSYDSEPACFRMMEEFCLNSSLVRESKIHREIYLSDARKTPPERLKTILRFKVHRLKEQ
jgi:hypothetical protein